MTLNPSFTTAADLVPGQVYRVKAAFIDYDGIVHHIGETWRFVSKNFLPYEDGLTLEVEQDGQRQVIRLQWRPEAQGEIIECFSGYVEAVDSAPAQPAVPRGKKRRTWVVFVAVFALILATFICLAVLGFLIYFLQNLPYHPGIT